MHWLLISIFAYFLNATAILIDKFLLKKEIPNAAVYTFYVSVLGLLALIVFPLPIPLPMTISTIAGFASGLIFVLALFIFYTLLKRNEASKIVPLVGGISPIFIFLLAPFILGETLTSIQAIAFIIILTGGWLILWEKKSDKKQFPKTVFWLSLATAFLFGFAHILSKFSYINLSFGSGFAIRSIGAFLGGLLFLAFHNNREAIFATLKGKKKRIDLLFLLGQGCGAASFVLVHYAFSIGSITLVNALAGIQYIFVFMIAIALYKKHPHILEEKITSRILTQKIVSLILISAGIAILFM
jgi:drug/metabolite transporter (DMT)-like permease